MPQKKNPVSDTKYRALTPGLARNYPRQIGQGVWSDVWSHDGFEKSAFDVQQGYGGGQGTDV
jgi:hypothetical protein